jgi:prepilin-type N-terminal cleavage/methylation domain-containing protein
MTRTRQRGFTMVEMMVVVLIIGTLATLAWAAFGRQKPRQTLNGFSAELGALLHASRQNAFASGFPVVVMFFPDQATPLGTGRIIIYQEGSGTFFSAAGAPNFGTYDPVARPVGPQSEVTEVLDVPFGVVIGPADGQGAAALMPAPYAGIPINTACVFCTGTNRRGAIVFDPTGSVSFHDANGPALALPIGASFSLRSSANDLPTTAAAGAEVRTIVIAASTGSLQTLAWAP